MVSKIKTWELGGRVGVGLGAVCNEWARDKRGSEVGNISSVATIPLHRGVRAARRWCTHVILWARVHDHMRVSERKHVCVCVCTGSGRCPWSGQGEKGGEWEVGCKVWEEGGARFWLQRPPSP